MPNDEIRWQTQKPTFRQSFPHFDRKRGTTYYICEELIEGRWEGFVSLGSL